MTAALAIVLVGPVVAHSATSPSFVTTITLARMPTDAVIDTRTGRIFVATIDAVIDTRTGRISVAARSGFAAVNVLDMHSGRVIRTVAIGPRPAHLAVDERAQRVFAASDNLVRGNPVVDVLDARSGAHVSRVPLTQSMGAGSIAAVSGVSHAFIAGGGASNNGSIEPNLVSILDTHTLRRVQTMNLGGPSGGDDALLVDEMHARVVESNGPRVSILDARTGRVLHTVTLANTASTLVFALAIDQLRSRALVETVPYPGQKALLTLLSTRTGQVQRTFSIPGLPRAAVFDELTGHVLLTTGPSFVTCSFPGSCPRAPGYVLVLDGGSGRVLRTALWQSWPSLLALDAPAHRAYIVDHAFLRVIDTRTGRIVHDIPLPTATMPRFILLDPRAHHVYVVAQGAPRL